MNFPFINACLNTTSVVLLILGYLAIRRKRIRFHAFLMCAAFVTSMVFLGFYLYYHYHHGSTRFTQEGWIRPVYFSILISHTILAIVNLPLVIATLIFAAKRNWIKHRFIARIAFPVWLYVSVTGVIVYWMLYRL